MVFSASHFNTKYGKVGSSDVKCWSYPLTVIQIPLEFAGLNHTCNNHTCAFVDHHQIWFSLCLCAISSYYIKQLKRKKNVQIPEKRTTCNFSTQSVLDCPDRMWSDTCAVREELCLVLQRCKVSALIATKTKTDTVYLCIASGVSGNCSPTKNFYFYTHEL